MTRLLILLGCCWLMACENDPQAVADLFEEVDGSTEVITDFQTIYSDSAQVKIRISGPRLIRRQEAGDFVQVFPDGLFVEFFDPTGAITSTLTSRYGERYENREYVVVRDSVVWQAVAGDRLDTDELIWEAAEERIYSDRYVRLQQGDKVITGVGFESNQDFTRSKVRAVQGVVRR